MPTSWINYFVKGLHMRWRLWRVQRHRAAFTRALIGLAGKLAGADGRVDEVERETFRRMLNVREEDWQHIRNQFDLVSHSELGAELYARDLLKLTKARPQRRLDILLGLGDMARADGVVTNDEEHFLRSAGQILCLSHHEIDWALGVCNVSSVSIWSVLGFHGPVNCALLKHRYRELARVWHPDAALARGVPPGMIIGFTERFVDIQNAYKEAMKVCLSN